MARARRRPGGEPAHGGEPAASRPVADGSIGAGLRASASSAAVEVELHVLPRAGADAVGGLHGGALRVRVRAAPEAGAANQAVCRALAHALGVAARDVVLRSGARSRRKRVRVSGEPAQLLSRLLALAGAERPV